KQQDRLAEPLRERAEAIARQCNRLIELIQSILEYTRLERGQLPVRAQPVDLSAVAADVVHELRELAGRKPGLALRANAPPGHPPAHTDPKLIRIVLVNLVSNAIRYTERAWIAIVVEHGKDGHRLAVRDKGQGIRAEYT